MSARPYVDSFLLGGVELIGSTNYVISYRITATKNNDDYAKGTAILTLDSRDVIDFSTTTQIVISRGLTTATENYLMRGYMMKFEEKDGSIMIQFEGRFSQYKRKLITYSFDKDIDVEAGNVSKIWSNIATAGGLTASYVDSGTDILLDKFICNDSYRFERMNTLVKVLGWQHYDDYDLNALRLEPRGYTTYPTTLQVGVNVLNIPFWEEERESIRNYIKIKGAYEEDTKTQAFTGDGVTTVFTVTDEPETTKVTIAGTEKTRGVVGSTTTYDYVVDKQRKTFTFVTPPAGAAAISIQYTYRLPKPVQAKDYTSIDYYEFERAEAITFKDVMTVADAEVRVKQLLKYMAYATVKTTLMCYNTLGIKPGMLVSVIDPNNPKYNNSYLVNEIEYQYPEPFDILQIGSSDFNLANLMESINERLRALEQEYELNSGTLTSLMNNVVVTQAENRYFKKENSTTKSDVLYWDLAVQDKWDMFKWSDGSADAKTTLIMMPGKNNFKEYVYDSLFYDSTNSVDVTWDTTDNEITIAPDGVLITEPISIGIPYTTAKLITGTVTGGTLTYEASGNDGSSWETITPSTTHTFIAAVTNVLIRITNNGATDAVIQVDKTVSNEMVTPALEVQLT